MIGGDHVVGDRVNGSQIKAEVVQFRRTESSHKTILVACAVAIGIVVAALLVWRVLSAGDSIRVANVPPEIEAALRLAYSGERQEAAPSAAVEVMVQPGVKVPQIWHRLADGQPLSSSDNYRIFFQPKEPAHFYVFQIDATGKLDWLFPKNRSP